LSKIIFQEIPIGEISPNPHNPRKAFAGLKFDELVESIKQKGIIEPIIVRPVKDKKASYEIIAGERRFKAAEIVKLETIPAVVRELSDDEAFDFMVIENLQREDLTEIEEAESFKAYLGKHGKEGAVELAERTGIRPQYIRRRVAVLDLPFKAVDAWRKGKIVYGHLEQLLRVKEKEAREKLIAEVLRSDSWAEPMSAKQLREEIDEMAPRLSHALFDKAVACLSCSNNSRVQKALFAIEGANDLCLDPKCFKHKQNDWLTANWKLTEFHESYKTNGFRFSDSFRRGSYQEFHDWSTHPAKKCFSCDKFVTILDSDGQEVEKRACLDPRCYDQLAATGKAAARGEKIKAVEKGGARVAWHGEYFRNVFFRKAVPPIVEKLDPEDPKIKTMLLMCLAYANSEARRALRKSLGLKSDTWQERNDAFPKLLLLTYEKIKPIFPDVVQAVFLEGQNVGDWNGFGSANRRLAAEFLGVDLAKEWAADEEYLQKKTKAELLAFGKKSGIFADKKIKEYLQKNFNKKATVENIKKSELVDVFLKSGANLVGRVPDEILKSK
jgi:ParB family transcriptional regulator, chromosome partitioning protein